MVTQCGCLLTSGPTLYVNVNAFQQMKTQHVILNSKYCPHMYSDTTTLNVESTCAALRLHQQLCVNTSRSPWLRRPLQVQHCPLSLQPPDYDLSIVTRRGNDPQRGALTHSQDVRFMDTAGLPRHICFNVQILKAKEALEWIYFLKNLPLQPSWLKLHIASYCRGGKNACMKSLWCFASFSSQIVFIALATASRSDVWILEAQHSGHQRSTGTHVPADAFDLTRCVFLIWFTSFADIVQFPVKKTILFSTFICFLVILAPLTHEAL